jgi:hypothetical protein
MGSLPQTVDITAFHDTPAIHTSLSLEYSIHHGPPYPFVNSEKSFHLAER